MTTPLNPQSEPTPLTDASFLATPAVPRRRRPLWLRVLVVLGGLAALLFGGCVIFSFFCRGERWDDPAQVLAAAREITEFELPDGYVGEVAEIVDTPMFGVHKAIFRHESGKGVLVLTAMDVHWAWLAKNDDGLRAGLDQLAGDMRVLIPSEESKQSVTIRSQPAEFEIRAGQDAASSTKLHEVRGRFPAKSGLAQLWWQAEDSVWNAESQERLLKSLAAE